MCSMVHAREFKKQTNDINGRREGNSHPEIHGDHKKQIDLGIGVHLTKGIEKRNATYCRRNWTKRQISALRWRESCIPWQYTQSGQTYYRWRPKTENTWHIQRNKYRFQALKKGKGPRLRVKKMGTDFVRLEVRSMQDRPKHPRISKMPKIARNPESNQSAMGRTSCPTTKPARNDVDREIDSYTKIVKMKNSNRGR